MHNHSNGNELRILMQIKLISLTIVEHQDSLRNRDKQQLGNGPLLRNSALCAHFLQNPQNWNFSSCCFCTARQMYVLTACRTCSTGAYDNYNDTKQYHWLKKGKRIVLHVRTPFNTNIHAVKSIATRKSPNLRSDPNNMSTQM